MSHAFRKDATILLAGLWRTEFGTYFLGYLNQDQFTQLAVNNIDEAIDKALELSNKGKNVFFGCAVYENALSRKGQNVKEVWGFWMDIDCGEVKAAKGQGYLSKDDALVAIFAFCAQCQIPNPTHIVDSGGGYHVYWAIMDSLDPLQWTESAKKFKQVADNWGFLADPSRTSDIASVLRMPGTFNYKPKYDQPRLVKLEKTSGVIETFDMVASIEQAYVQISPKINIVSPVNKTEVFLLETDTNIAKVKTALGFIDPDCDYDFWRRICCSIKSFNWQCSEQLANEWSRGDYFLK